MPRPLLLGHRGARATKGIPENTLSSFDLALSHGCDGFEFDVQLTADGECLICHDPAIGGREIAKSERREFPTFSSLDDVLARYAGQAFLDIELKVAGLEIQTADLVRKYHFPKGFVVSSFLPDVLSVLHRRDPDLPLGLICEARKQLEGWSALPLTHVIPHYKLITTELVNECHTAGKKVLGWTVNSAQKMLELQSWEVDGIISDDTVLLATTLGGK
jgi:glycerophosphoryl diester phosphodiesterase